MSMNIRINAVKGKFKTAFGCMQTPTAVSYQILDSPDRVEAYRQWAEGRNKDHAKKFKRWADAALSEGLTIEVYAT